AGGELLVRLQRGPGVAPRLEDERARRAVLRLGVGEAHLERVALGDLPGTPGLLLRHAGELVEDSATDAQRPARVAHERELDDAELVERATARGLLLQAE